MNITKELLLKFLPNCPKNKIDEYLPCLEAAMIDAQINTNERLAMFLAQCGHESGSFRYLEEIASGQAYEGRKDLGNTQPGDGVRYKGRGVIQCTGRANYKAYSDYTGIDFVENPKEMLLPIYAFGVAAWYWNKNNLNKFSDAKDIKGCTKKINGGFNGLKEREELYNKIINILNS